jgi:hypothetical protein
MSDNSDYKLDYLKIDELFPSVFNTDVNKSVYSNSFNRFLTKNDNVRVTGTIGNQLNVNIIQEDTIHRQANQLQPLIFSTNSTAEELGSIIDVQINSFKDILTKSAQIGIDIDKFDQWGDCNQFVFAPPIDIDKFINYRDYFWTDVSEPDYITIENKITVYQSALFEANNTLTLALQNKDASLELTARRAVAEYSIKLNDAITDVTSALTPTNTSTPINHKYMWSATNTWVHRSDLVITQDGKPLYNYAVPATMPIIEYADDIEVNEWIFLKHNWLYRKDAVSPWIKSNTEPTTSELSLRIPIISANLTKNSFVVEYRDGLYEGLEFFVTQSLYNNGVYKIISLSTNTVAKTIEIIVDKLVRSTGAANRYVQYDSHEYYGTAKVTEVDNNSVKYNLTCGTIVPVVVTSYGDPWLGLYAHWKLDSIEKPVPAPNQPINPEQYSVSYKITQSGFGFDEDMTLDAGSYGYDDQVIFDIPGTYILDSDDIQVYFNGVRQYGTYDEIKEFTPAQQFDIAPLDTDRFSLADNNSTVLVDKIQLLTPLNVGDVLTIKVGAAALSDTVRRQIPIRVHSVKDSDAKPNIMISNIMAYRKHEPAKIDNNQYINFNIYDVFGKHTGTANNIFKYKEDSQAAVHPILNVRTPTHNGNYVFEQLLFDGKLLCYKQNSVLTTIWKPAGKYVPVKVDAYRQPLIHNKTLADGTKVKSTGVYVLNDGSTRESIVGDWDIPDPLRYNVMHECRNELLYTEMFAHFTSILSAQVAPSGIDLSGAAAGKLLTTYNYKNGTIKEHNGGFDFFISAMHQNAISILSLFRFAKTQYASCLQYLHSEVISAIISSIAAKNTNFDDLIATVTPIAIAAATNNIKLNSLFFDSTTSDGGTGLPNWIATLPILGLIPATQPTLLDDGKIRKVRHHDGHLSDFALTEKDLNKIKQVLTVVESDERPAFSQGTLWLNNGFYICTADIVSNNEPPINMVIGSTWYKPATETLFQKSTNGWDAIDISNAWVLIDFSLVIASVVLDVERRLYERATSVAPNVMYRGLSAWIISNDYPALQANLKSAYIEYVKSQQTVLPVYDFNLSDPFTYNYSKIPTNSNTVINYQNSRNWAARWYTIYELQYGTAYPHLEPWVLQGYVTKPTNWDQIYKSTNTTARWKTSMWANIREGVIHSSLQTTPSNVPVYSVLSVNDTDTTYGSYTPGDLLPPYVAIAELINNNSLITGPLPAISSIKDTYSFGQQSLSERSWMDSIEYPYAKLAAMFKLQPIKTLYTTFGIDTITVNGLHIDVRTQRVPTHTDTIFHGITNS